MMKLSIKVALSVYLLLAYSVTFAYKESTHQEFSVYATEHSVLMLDPSLLNDFGLNPYGTREFKSSEGTETVQTLIKFGSKFEDDGGGSFFQFIDLYRTHRFFRHFFDPQSGRGLTVLHPHLTGHWKGAYPARLWMIPCRLIPTKMQGGTSTMPLPAKHLNVGKITFRKPFNPLGR